ncbi:MAG TPA: hypothetical protein V6D50_09340 [Chroococcales cyanobacterium]
MEQHKLLIIPYSLAYEVDREFSQPKKLRLSLKYSATPASPKAC